METFKQQKYVLVLLIFSCLILYGCKKQENVDMGNYLSISVTEYNNGVNTDNEMTTSIMTYDIESDALLDIDSFDYTTQYPLGIYLKSENKLYYSSYADNGDQLFEYNVIRDGEKQLTQDLYAINYILPREEDIMVVAVKKGTRPIALYCYDKESRKLIDIINDNDTNIQAISYNNSDNTSYYTSEYSEKAIQESGEKVYSGKIKLFIPPDYTVYRYDKNNNRTHIYTSDNRQVSTVSGNNDFVIWKEYIQETVGPFEIKLLNLSSNEIEILDIDKINSISELSIRADNKGFYFLGAIKDLDDRGVFYYDFSTKNIVKLITGADNKYINNFMMIPH